MDLGTKIERWKTFQANKIKESVKKSIYSKKRPSAPYMKRDHARGQGKSGDFLTGTKQMNTKIHVSMDQGQDECKEWTFSQYFSIGRLKSADVYLPVNHVSRLHAAVFIRDGKWWLQDLKSANGTIVNGKRITKHRSHPLKSENQLLLSEAGPILKLRIKKMKLTKEVQAVANPEQVRNDKHSPTWYASLSMNDHGKRSLEKLPTIAIITGSVMTLFVVLVMITYIQASF